MKRTDIFIEHFKVARIIVDDRVNCKITMELCDTDPANRAATPTKKGRLRIGFNETVKNAEHTIENIKALYGKGNTLDPAKWQWSTPYKYQASKELKFYNVFYVPEPWLTPEQEYTNY